MTEHINFRLKTAKTMFMKPESRRDDALTARSAVSAAMAAILFLLAVVSTTGWPPVSAKAADNSCIPVETAKVVEMDLERTVQGIGTLEAIQQVMIRPEVNGVIESVHFREGSRVKKGDLLFSMDDNKIIDQLQARQAALAEARANLENAELVYNRRERLYRQKLGTEEARDEARAKYRALSATIDRIKAEIEGIKETLADTKIKAPFAGIIGERYVDPGEWVDIGTRLAPLVETDRLKIAFTIPEKYLGQAKTGQTIKLRTPAFPDRDFIGAVYFVSPLIREDTRSLMVKAYVDNPNLRLSPGGFGAVELIVDILEQKPVVPEEALVPTRTGYMIYTIKDGKALGRDVKIGLRHPGTVEIRKGVTPGETIIKSGHIAVSEGDTVCSQQ
ncbi:MAG: efflux RND transporter periplasmic adaptor subunit [Desulfobacterales bacterium]|nr:efflux RND transporter periplasmic adaptor subunit [Desulfobacterales bacterium]